MFGYIVPAPDALSADDKNIFRDFYCSLCREIGSRSQLSRLSLSYDMTFLAILIAALGEKEPEYTKTVRCPMHPIKATNHISSEALTYSADMSVILIKEKLKDDARDEKNPIYSLADKLIKDNIANIDKPRDAVSKHLNDLAKIEASGVCNPDLAADCFAKLCGDMFAFSPAPEREKKTLYWLGYNLGRWIYLTDAYHDLEHDIKKKSYNPFADGNRAEYIQKEKGEEIVSLLNFTLAEAASAFDLLNIRRYRSLLENIIYIGLPARLSEVVAGTERKKRV